MTCKQPEVAMQFINIRSEPEVFAKTFLCEEGVQYEIRDNNGVKEYWPIFPGFTEFFNGHWFPVAAGPKVFTTLWLCRARKSETNYKVFVLENRPPRDHWVDTPLGMVPPFDSQAKYQEACNKLENDFYLEVIAGTRPVDDYDSFVEKWRAEGGDEMIKEIDAYFTK